MNKLWLAVVFLLLATSVSFGAEGEKAYTGEIMDSTCAKMGNHDAGYKLRHEHPEGLHASLREVRCEVVLYNASTKTVYELDNQDKANHLAGEKVKVEGTLSHATKTIHVDTIQTAP